jgi:hypothetical protein
MKYRSWTVSAVLAASAALSACDVTEQTTSSPDLAASVLNSSASHRQGPTTSDEEMAIVANNEVKGFAGLYRQEDGTPVVLLTDPSQRGAAQRYLATRLGKGRGSRAGGVEKMVVRTVAYDFAQLKQWHDQLGGLFARGDVYMTDVDEARNQVFVGVRDQTAIGEVRSAAARLGIPAAALRVETQAAPEKRITLRERPPLLQGGYQIDMWSGAGGECTLGFNAVYNGQSVFVTNAHCSQTQYSLDYGTIWQPNVAAGAEIGTEIADVPLHFCGPYIASYLPCRHSDASIYANNGAVAADLGKLAQTAWQTGKAAGITVTTVNTITSRYTTEFLSVGDYLDKTGRTTGTTYGTVTQTCVRIGSLMCQDVSKVYSAPGDSGSPMYVWLGTGSAKLYGILWGGPGSDYTTTYSSRLGGIENDFDANLTVCAPGYGC